jgi:hypothetical protein
MRVKFFWKNDPLGPQSGWSSALPAEHAQALEDQINAWLAEHPEIRVVEIKQSTTGSLSLESITWLVSVWYEEATSQPMQPPEERIRK